MKSIIMDFLVLLLFLIGIWKVEVIKPFCKFNEDYLSLKFTKMMKGFFSLVVIFHHIAQRTSDGILFHKFTLVGYLATSVFFFISGYGLQKKYMMSKDYDQKFLKKRLPGIVIPYVVMTFVYWIIKNLLGDKCTFLEILNAIKRGTPIVSFSWYVITILVFYFVFYLLMKICKKNNKAMILGSFLYYIFWVFLCRELGYESYWYNSAHLLVVGVVYAILENKLLPFFKSCYRAVFPIVLFFFSICFYYPNEIAKFLPVRGIKFLVPCATAFFFVVMLLLLSLKYRVGNKVLGYLGDISFEIYLLQGICFLLLRNNYIYVGNPILYAVIILSGTILLAHLFHKLFQYLLNKYKN